MSYTRREFAKLAVGAVSAAGLLSQRNPLFAAEPISAPRVKPDSRVNGVQIGLNVPYSFGNNALNAEETLANCVSLGVSAVELRTQPVELFLGGPILPIRPRGTVVVAAEAAAAAQALAKWRLSVSMDRVRDFRKKFEDAGVMIEIVKVDGLLTMKEDTLDYFFTLAKALGGRALSTEISGSEENLKRVGQFADKHQFMVGLHGHAGAKPATWERAFSFAKYNGANVDLGHFVAGNNASPVEFIKQQHQRITHVHVKDRKLNSGPNVPFGEGDTPIVEVLRLIRDNRWPIQATIEFEYPIPTGSTRMAEIARAIQFCRNALA